MFILTATTIISSLLCSVQADGQIVTMPFGDGLVFSSQSPDGKTVSVAAVSSGSRLPKFFTADSMPLAPGHLNVEDLFKSVMDHVHGGGRSSGLLGALRRPGGMSGLFGNIPGIPGAAASQVLVVRGDR